MKRSLDLSRVSARLILGLAISLLSLPASAASTTIVISQVYGGGGNSGATLRNDFIELFNRGSSPVDVTGWSVQYASATGTTWQTTPLAGIIPPGGYFLVQQSQGAGGTVDLPTPDAIGTIPMSATAGKIALLDVDTTIASGTSCPAGPTVVDLVGYGTANCFEGSGPTAAPSNTTAVLRGSGGCADTDQNVADFSVVAPSPRNSTSPAAPCSGPTNPSGTGAATPNSAPAGASVLLTVAVTPGGSPPSTGLAVSADLTSIGGSASQPFFDDGTNGDAVAGDNTFSFQATVAPGTTPGGKTLPVTISDAEGRSGATSIAFVVQAPLLPISAIQGTGTISPHAGSFVTTTGVVTGVKSNGFFLQTPDASTDGDPASSEGIFVFTSTAPPGSAAAGNVVEVSGTVQEFVPSADPVSPPLTEVAGFATVTLVSTGNPLPLPVTLTSTDTSPAGSIEQLERLEAMRVAVSSLTVTAPTQGGVIETTATGTSNGVFYGVITGIPRPFREPGVPVPDPLPPGAPCCVPRFDANPERLRVDSDGLLGATPLEVTAGAVVTNLVGPLDYGFRTYTLLPEPGSAPGVSGNVSATPVRVAMPGEFTVGSFNLNRFFDDVNDPGIGEPVLTATAFANRLAKASLAIRNVMRSPEIIGVQEAEGLPALQALAARINADTVAGGGSDPQYQAYLEEGNDIGGIDVGFLVKSSRVDVGAVTQEGKTATYVNPVTGLPELLNDRPPLLLQASVRSTPTHASFPLLVIVNHLRSLNGVDDPVDGPRVRAKRRAQAEFLANLIQTRQGADPAQGIVSLGDYNAFEFNDGYVDLLGTIRGAPTPPDQVVLASGDLVNPDLTNLISSVPQGQRYSYVFDGNAQVLDHVLVNAALLSFSNGLEIAHNGADFPETYRNDASRPERLSDHDMPVAYFRQTPLPQGWSFYTVVPCRLADTRGNGFAGPSGPPALAAGAQRSFPISGTCGIPVTARAVALNLTVTNTTADGHLTLFPSDIAAPPTSTLNFRGGQTRANNAIERLVTNGTVSIANRQASGTVDLLIDVTGYFE